MEHVGKERYIFSDAMKITEDYPQRKLLEFKPFQIGMNSVEVQVVEMIMVLVVEEPIAEWMKEQLGNSSAEEHLSTLEVFGEKRKIA